MQTLTNYAKSFIGKPYSWAGETPMGGFDCSGLVQTILRSVGLDPAGDQSAQALMDYATVLASRRSLPLPFIKRCWWTWQERAKPRRYRKIGCSTQVTYTVTKYLPFFFGSITPASFPLGVTPPLCAQITLVCCRSRVPLSGLPVRFGPVCGATGRPRWRLRPPLRAMIGLPARVLIPATQAIPR